MNSIKKHYIAFIIVYITMQALATVLFDGRPELIMTKTLIIAASFIAAYLPLHDFYEAGNRSENIHKLCVGLGALFHLAGELAWVYNAVISDKELNLMTVDSNLYLMRNIIIMIAGLIVLFKYAGKWNKLKSIVDIFVFGTFTVYIFWISFLKFYNMDFSLEGSSIVFFILYIMTDIMILFEYLMMYMYETEYFKSAAKRTEIAGFIILVVADWWNNYGMALRGYFPHIWDLVLPLSLFMISIGMLETKISVKNCKEHHKLRVELVIWLILTAAYLIIIKLNVNIHVRVLFMVTLIFRIIAIKYIRVYEINEELVKNYIEANAMLKSKMYEASKLFCDLENMVRLRTQELKEKNSELFYLSNIDFLTGLPNRRNFVEYLDNLILKSKNRFRFAIFFIDIDRFKSINDWYGHDVGDYILVETSKRLSKNLSDGDMVARLGGDEFVVIINTIESETYVMKIAEKMVSDIRAQFVLKDKKIFTTISIGIAFYPLNANERSSLMKCADIALYRSKAEGKNKAIIYDWNMKTKENRRLEIENRIGQALENNEFYLCYQPQFELNTGAILGIEALVRWESMGLGDIAPIEFLEIAEENGMILSIGNRVIKESIMAVKHLNSKYDMNLRVAINISPKQFIEPDFVNKLREAIFQYDIKSSWIELEITEELTMNNEELVLAKLIEISNIGVRIVIDNFGTGYSSFLYLKRFPISAIKIAMELVKGIGESLDDYKIVKSIISMCREMEVDVMAEGVENQIQKDILKTIGCHSVQGYFSGGTMTVEEIEKAYCRTYKARGKIDYGESMDIKTIK